MRVFSAYFLLKMIGFILQIKLIIFSLETSFSLNFILGQSEPDNKQDSFV